MEHNRQWMMLQIDSYQLCCELVSESCTMWNSTDRGWCHKYTVTSCQAWGQLCVRASLSVSRVPRRTQHCISVWWQRWWWRWRPFLQRIIPLTWMIRALILLLIFIWTRTKTISDWKSVTGCVSRSAHSQTNLYWQDNHVKAGVCKRSKRTKTLKALTIADSTLFFFSFGKKTSAVLCFMFRGGHHL